MIVDKIEETVKKWSTLLRLASLNMYVTFYVQLEQNNFQYFDEIPDFKIFFKQLVEGFNAINEVPPINSEFQQMFYHHNLRRMNWDYLFNTMVFASNTMKTNVMNNILMNGEQRIKKYLKQRFHNRFPKRQSILNLQLYKFIQEFFYGGPRKSTSRKFDETLRTDLNLTETDVTLLKQCIGAYILRNERTKADNNLNDEEADDLKAFKNVKWFGLIPIFYKLLVQCEERKFKTFRLLPLFHRGVHNIRFDSTTIHGFINRIPTCSWNSKRNDFVKSLDWNKYFNVKELETAQHTFDGSISTNGLEVSILMRRRTPTKEEREQRNLNRIQRQKRKSIGNEYKIVIGIDPGRSNALAVTIWTFDENGINIQQENFILRSKTVHYETGFYNRKRQQGKIISRFVKHYEMERRQREEELNGKFNKKI